MNLIVIPFHDWKKCEHEGFRTRDAHFMEEFGRHPSIDKVLIIDRPTTLAELLILRKNWRVRHGTNISLTGNSELAQVGPKTYVLSTRLPDLIRPILLKRKWVPMAYAKTTVVQCVQNALTMLEMSSNYSLFISAPLYVKLVAELSPNVFVLDAQDNLLKHSLYRNTPNLASYYEYCRKHADIIYANSIESTRWLAEGRTDAHYIGNGVDSRKMDATKHYQVPEDIVPLKVRPIIGYAGKMQEMVDVQLVEKLITRLPQVNFVFIGQILQPEWVKSLWQYPNVFHLGDKNYEDLPAYLSSFDICTIPYSVARQHGGDPIKFYEYLSMRKPVVTTNIGGVSEFSDYEQVWIANSHKEFLTGCTYFLDKLSKSEPIVIRPIPEKHTWECKVNNIVDDIEKALLNK